MARSLVIVESPQRRKRLTSIWVATSPSKRPSTRHGPAKKTIGIRLPGEEEGGKKKRKAKKGSKKAKEKPAGKVITLDDDRIFEPTLQNYRWQRQGH